MPPFNTGNAGWDSTLGNLSGALFPDPSKQTEAYYYGAQARKSLTESAKMRDQSAAGHDMRLQMYGQGQPTPDYKLDPATGLYVQNDPAARYPGAGAAAAGPAAPASAAAPSLSAAVAPMPIPGAGAPPGDPRASINLQVAPTGEVVPGHWNPPTATSDQVVQQLSAKVAGSPGGMPPAGTRPTGSNGTQAPDQPGTLDGVLAPSSVNASGTDTPAGKIQAPPAAKDGSMGPLAIDLQKLTATAIAAGTPADQMYAQNKAVIGRALETGKISQPVADALLANYGGDASSRNAQISAASALATTNATQAGETARKMAELVDMPDPNDPTKTIKVPLGQVQGQGGRVTMAPSAQTAANTNVQVKLPNGTVVWQRAGAPMPPGATNYDSALEQTKQQQGGAKGSYFDTKTATVHFVDAQTAQDNGWITLPDSKEKLDALLGTELSNAKTPEQAQEIRDRYMRFASLPKPVDQAAQFQQQQIDYATDQRLNPMPAPGVTPTGLTNPVAYAPDAQRAIEERAQQLMSRDPFMQNNPGRAHERAIQELRDEHSIPTVDQVNEMRGHWGPKVQGALFGNPKLSLYQPPGGKAQEHLMVGLIPKQPGAPGAGGGTPTSQATPAQTAVTPPAQTAVTPPAQTAVTPPAQTAVTPPAQTAVTPPAPSSLSTIVTPPLPQETRQAPVARGSASPRAMVRPSYLPPPQQGPPAPPSPLALTRSPRAFPRTTVPPAPAAPAAPAVAQPAVPGGGRFGQTGQLPAGAVSVAPAGLPDGSTMPNPAGGNFVVHGGFVFPG